MTALSQTKLFGFGVGFMLLAGSIVSIKNAMFPAALSACTERYAPGAVFPQAGGAAQPIGIRDIETKLGFDEWGLTQNVSLVRDATAPSPVTLDVRIAKGTGGGPSAESGASGGAGGPRGGVSFSWRPGIVNGTHAACLSYSVLMPDGFDFHYGGMLPGLAGGEQPRQGLTGFAARMAWRPQGAGEVAANVPVAEPGKPVSLATDRWTIARGRWVKIEQEVVLNRPGATDGSLVIWIDGELAMRRDDVTWRSNDKVRITGVLSDVYYDGQGTEGLAPRDTLVRLTPFDLRWR